MTQLYSGGYTPPGVPFRFGHTFKHYVGSASVFYCPANRYIYEKRIPGGYDPPLTMSMNMGMNMPRCKGYNRYGSSGQFWTTYAMPAVIDPIASQHVALGHTTNGDYWNWYRTYGGYYLPNMEHSANSFLYNRAYQNGKSGRPMVFDTSRGPGAEGDGSLVTILNHELRFANVAYFDGRVVLYPHAKHIYDFRNYAYGYRGFTERHITQILRRFGNGDKGAR